MSRSFWILATIFVISACGQQLSAAVTSPRKEADSLQADQRQLQKTKARGLKMLTGSQPVSSCARILEYLLDPPPGDGGDRE
jgi:hypothetical protein